LAFGLHMAAQTQSLWMLAVEGGVALVLHREVTAPVPQLPLETHSPLAKFYGPQGV
jgi:hypothetical protein